MPEMKRKRTHKPKSELEAVRQPTSPEATKRGQQGVNAMLKRQMQQGDDFRKSLGNTTLASPPAYKKGGKVKKTGMALVHKGEKVLTKKQASKKGAK